MKADRAKLINDFLQRGKADAARQIFNDTEPEDTEEYWLLKGKIEQKYQNWGDALNAYSKVLEFNKNNPEAQNNTQIIKNILNFWSPEMFNP